MRTAIFVSALAGLAAAAPRPQDIDLDEVIAVPPASIVGPDVTAVTQTAVFQTAPAAASASAAAIADPISDAVSAKRDLESRGVNDACAPQPDGYGPLTRSPDTAAAFLANSTYASIASSAPVPEGYQTSFTNLQASVSANTYLGLYTFKTYDTIQCQQKCDATDLCTAFNIYFERDPTVNPATACPNPASFTNIKCTLWGSSIAPETAVNKGQYRRDFQVVIAGSNGYYKNTPPSAQPNFDGPLELGGAINAPLYNGKNTYIGMKFFPNAYDPGQCAAACQATTGYDTRHPRSDGTYDACNFFNAYVLSKNNAAQGTYCSLYTKPWDKSYSTNYGQYRGSDYYSVSSSYGYTLSKQDSGVIVK